MPPPKSSLAVLVKATLRSIGPDADALAPRERLRLWSACADACDTPDRCGPLDLRDRQRGAVPEPARLLGWLLRRGREHDVGRQGLREARLLARARARVR